MLIRPGQKSADPGYTLVEVMVALALAGAMLALAVLGFRNWTAASGHSGTAAEVRSVLRSAQSQAISEGVSFCVSFDTDKTYTVYRYACDNAAREHVNGPIRVNTPLVNLDAQFSKPGGGTLHGVTFTPRGSAWSGTVRVERENSTKVHVVTVEGMTGRVSLS